MPNAAEKIVLDLETQRSFDQVEGRNPKLLGVSVVGIYSYKHNQFKVFPEKEQKKVLDFIYLMESRLFVTYLSTGEVLLIFKI